MKAASQVQHPTLLTVEDLAARWAVAPWAVYRMARANAIPSVRIGRRMRFSITQIEAWEAAGGSTQHDGKRRRARP